MIPEQETVERCPTCGATVEVVTADEGTSHYRPAKDERLEAAEARALKATAALERIAQAEICSVDEVDMQLLARSALTALHPDQPEERQ